MDLYFSYRDGQAVTCDDFVGCMAETNGVGSRPLHALVQPGRHAAREGRRRLGRRRRRLHAHLSQSHPAHPGPADKLPLHIPVAVGLIGPGRRRPALPCWPAKPMPRDTSRVLNLKEPPAAGPSPASPPAGALAAARLLGAGDPPETRRSDERLAFRMAFDADPSTAGMPPSALHGARRPGPRRRCRRRPPAGVPQAFGHAFRALLVDDSLDAAFVAETLPAVRGLSARPHAAGRPGAAADPR